MRVSVGDLISLLQLETAVGRGAMAVGVEYHGGLGGIGIKNSMVDGVRRLGGGHTGLVLGSRTYVENGEGKSA